MQYCFKHLQIGRRPEGIARSEDANCPADVKDSHRERRVHGEGFLIRSISRFLTHMLYHLIPHPLNLALPRQ